MAHSLPYSSDAPSRETIDTLPGPAVLQFGTDWCGHCNAAEPLVMEAMAQHTGVQRIKVEDGSGRPLGRSFKVKLWPTLIFLRDGQEVARLVRPTEVSAVAQALAQINIPA